MLTEKAAYLKGLMDGLEIDGSTKEGKVLLALIDVVNEICETVDTIDADVDDIVEFCDTIDQDLSDVEDAVFGDDDCDCCDCDDCDCDCDCDDDCDCDCCCDEDDCVYEVECPTCGDTIELNDLMLEDGSIVCPNCGELLEFDFDEEIEDEDEK